MVVPSPRTRCAVVAGAVAGALLLGGCSGAPSGGTGAGGIGAGEIRVSAGACGPGWSARGGTQTFQVHNAGTAAAEVDLVDPATSGVYAEVAALGPGTTRPVRVTLGDGVYAWRCLTDDSDPITGPAVRVSGAPGAGAVPVLPVTYQDLRPAVAAYRRYVTAGLATLAGRVDALGAAVRTGDPGAARAAWLAANLAYQRLGAAYDTFDDFGDRIDGRPDGLPGGVRDPGFTGLRRIEYGLWHGAPPASLVPVVSRLAGDVAGLRRAFPSQETDPQDLPRRAHEILEDAVTFELTGAADQGSGTGLATVDANLDGTRAVLDALTPVLASRYPGWTAVGTWLRRTRTAVESARRPDGSWPPPTALDPVARRRLDGDLGQLLEDLAPIAAIGEVRRVS